MHFPTHPAYSFLSLPFATGAYWELLALTTQEDCNPLMCKEKSHLSVELSGGGAGSGVKMVCLPISPLPHADDLSKYNKGNCGVKAGGDWKVGSRTLLRFSRKTRGERWGTWAFGRGFEGAAETG